jgi:hypothetical protein
MTNGNGKERNVDSGVCFEGAFREPRGAGSMAPLFGEGRFTLSPEVAALAQLDGGAYLTVFGHKALREWIEEAEAKIGKMRGGIGIQFNSKPYRRDEESDESKHKRIILELYGKPTPSTSDEAALAGALASVGVTDPSWLTEHTVSS